MAHTPTATAQPLTTEVADTGVVYRYQVYLTEAQTEPVPGITWWTKHTEGTPVLRAVMTNLPARWQT